MRRSKNRLYIAMLFFFPFLTELCGQEREEVFPYGDFEEWMVREMKESVILGGGEVTVYAIAPTDTIRGNIPYDGHHISRWATSNVMARIMGIVKTSNTVYPEKMQDGGTCARLETRLASCRVLGMVDVTVLASGSMYLGRVNEPVRSAKDPYAKIDMGIPFTQRPRYVMFDYKAVISSDSTVTKATGINVEQIPGRDMADIYVFLQKRWEDDRGHLHVKRVGTMRMRIDESTEGWVKNHKAYIHYGDITGEDFFRPYMGLMQGETFHAMNSKGKMYPIVEEGWAQADETPTHIIMMFSAGCIGAYVGALENTLWVDNVTMGYETDR